MKKILASLFFTVLLAGCQTMSGPGFIGGSQQNTDMSITAAIQAGFDSNPQLAGVPVKIETTNGNVQLSGYVKTIRQSDMAADLASKANGVKFVENNLIVRK